VGRGKRKDENRVEAPKGIISRGGAELKIRNEWFKVSSAPLRLSGRIGFNVFSKIGRGKDDETKCRAVGSDDSDYYWVFVDWGPLCPQNTGVDWGSGGAIGSGLDLGRVIGVLFVIWGF